MDCQHSFQGNYSGGYVSFRYQSLLDSEDEAYVKAKAGWVKICTDIENSDQIVVKDYVASCMIYMANWMNGKKKHYIWNFEEKVLSLFNDKKEYHLLKTNCLNAIKKLNNSVVSKEIVSIYE